MKTFYLVIGIFLALYSILFLLSPGNAAKAQVYMDKKNYWLDEKIQSVKKPFLILIFVLGGYFIYLSYYFEF